MTNSEIHDKTAIQNEDSDNNKGPWLANLKAFLGHAGLCLALVAYTAIGGVSQMNINAGRCLEL